MRTVRIMALGLWWCGSAGLVVPQNSPLPVQGTLTEAGASPFYLQATITERGDPTEHIEVEMSWVSPSKWRRTIQSAEFSQTLIVNGDKVFEEDSNDYLPLGIQTLVTAMVDPLPILSAVGTGDQVMTKANGASDESGKMCFGPDSKICAKSRYGLTESVHAPGHSVDFADYQPFQGKRIARRLIFRIDPGDSLQARVTTLGQLTSHDEERFSIAEPTPKEKQIQSVALIESDLRELALQPLEIIWPQVLEDQTTSGETQYYVSLDRAGQVREVLPLSIAIERADDSARRQIMKWKFKPLTKDGVPMQAEGVLNFHFNTRAYGPAAVPTDEEARRLATNIVEPIYPKESKPGSTFSIRIAVDADGQVIESMAVEGARELFTPCSQAVGKWHFNPIMEDGKPRPYRAQITCRVP